MLDEPLEVVLNPEVHGCKCTLCCHAVLSCCAVLFCQPGGVHAVLCCAVFHAVLSCCAALLSCSDVCHCFIIANDLGSTRSCTPLLASAGHGMQSADSAVACTCWMPGERVAMRSGGSCMGPTGRRCPMSSPPLQSNDGAGLVIDGFPRTALQVGPLSAFQVATSRGWAC